MPKLFIVIPLYNNFQLLHEMLWSLYRKERENIDGILVVNDCSTDTEVEGGLKWWKAEWKEKADPLLVMTLENEENLGFLKTSNRGMKHIADTVSQDPNDIIILLSTDVKIYGKFVSQIKEMLANSPKSLVGGIVYNQDTGWNKFDQIYPYVEGWLLATTVANWKELDYFDELYSPHVFEDIDLSTKALSLGYELVALNNVGLQHLAGQSIKYTPERDELTKINQKKFQSKWLPQV